MKWHILLVFGLVFIMMGCIDVSSFLQQQAKEQFKENVTQPAYTPTANETPSGEEEVTIEEETPANTTEEAQVNETQAEEEQPEEVSCPETNPDDPYYCVTDDAIAQKDISLCEKIPKDAEESVMRCVKIIASTYGKDQQWCEDELTRDDTLDYCKRFVMMGHKRENY